MTDDEETDGDRGLGEFLGMADETIEMIESKADEEELGPALSYLDDLEDIVDEAEDVLSTMDLSELVEAIDWSALPETIDISDIEEAFGSGDPGDAVDLRELLDVLNLSRLMDSVDERELWREKREFDDELDDVTGEGSVDQSDDIDGDVDLDSPGGLSGGDVDPRAIQTAVQREISEAVGEFRETLVEAHHRLDAIKQENAARFEQRRGSSESRNPTAGFSTLPARHAGTDAAGRYAFSTVPEETRYSSAPNRERIYGHRFESSGGGSDG